MANLTFSPNNAELPVQVFLSILEYENGGDEADTEEDPVQVEKALVHLDSNKIRKKQMEALRSQTSWRDFKALMSRYFARDEEPLYNKVVLLQSLFKSPEENCHHYLIRVRYVAGLIRSSVSCECPTFLVDVEEWTRVLFMAGLDQKERNFCDINTLLEAPQGKLDLEAVSDLINISQNPALASQVRSRQPSTTKPKKEVPSVDDDSRPLNQLVYEAIMNTEQKQMSLAEIVRCIFSVPDPESALAQEGDTQLGGSNLVELCLLENPKVFSQVSVGETSQNTVWRAEAGADAYVYITGDVDENLDTLNRDEDITDQFMDEKDIKEEDFDTSEDYEPKRPQRKRKLTAKGLAAGLGKSRAAKLPMTETTGERKRGRKAGPTSAGSFQCQSCPKKFSKKYLLQDHTSEVHDGVKKLQCEICSFRCNRKRNLERHLESHLPSHDRKLWGCIECASTFTQKVSLRIHMEKLHDKVLTDFRTLTAAECDRTITPGKKSNDIKGVIETWAKETIIEIEESPEEDYDKIKDDQGYNKTDQELQDLGVDEESKFRCSMCEASFKFRHAYHDHKVKVHGVLPAGGRLFHCRIKGCSFQTLKRSNIYNHVISKHTLKDDRETYQCHACGKEYTHPTSLALHIKKVHENAERTYICSHCGNSFYTRQRLDQHIATHTSSLEDRKVHPCDTCGAKFAQKAHLTTHIRVTHLKIKQYRCKICSTAFSNTGNLEEHIGIKHLGFKDGKEWRKHKPANKHLAKQHEAYEYTPYSKIKDNVFLQQHQQAAVEQQQQSEELMEQAPPPETVHGITLQPQSESLEGRVFHVQQTSVAGTSAVLEEPVESKVQYVQPTPLPESTKVIHVQAPTSTGSKVFHVQVPMAVEAKVFEAADIVHTLSKV